jgi:hypothetical protein
MKTFASSLLVFLIFLLSSCSEKKDEFEIAADLTASVWGATTSIVTHESAKDSAGNAIDIVVLNMSGCRSIPQEYPVEQFVSTSAMLMVQNVNQTNWKGEDKIRIVSKERNADKTYLVKNVREAMELLPSVTDFLEAPNSGGLDQRKRCVDSTFVSDSLLSLLSDQLALSDSVQGPSIAHQVGGFQFGNVSGSNEPVLIVWASTTKKQMQIPFTFFVSRKSGKILSFSVNAN